MSFKIKTITAFISEDKNGEEGIVAHFANNQWFPLIAAMKKESKPFCLFYRDC
jgi:hypothetical protein